MEGSKVYEFRIMGEVVKLPYYIFVERINQFEMALDDIMFRLRIDPDGNFSVYVITTKGTFYPEGAFLPRIVLRS